MTWPFSLEARRARLHARLPEGPLRRYLARPLPDPKTDRLELKLLALDLETTGLEPERDAILAIGFVPVDGQSVRLAGAQRLLLRPEADLSGSAALHGLTDDALANGLTLSDALSEVLSALSGRVLLAHHAALETRFLSAACQRLYGAPLLCRSVDTLKLEQRLTSKGFEREREDGLRLQAARDRYGLPRYKAHDALADALACAELYLAQTSALAGEGRLRLGQVLG